MRSAPFYLATFRVNFGTVPVRFVAGFVTFASILHG
jgi:hypothetical protein